MTKRRLHNALLLMLITAFLSLQWSSAHIHLAGQHDHDGGQHAHSLAAHAHQTSDHARDQTSDHSFTHHGDLIDRAAEVDLHAANDHAVVELDHECSVSCWKAPAKQPLASLLPFYSAAVVLQLAVVGFTPPDAGQHGFLSRSTVQLRAPPLSA